MGEGTETIYISSPSCTHHYVNSKGDSIEFRHYNNKIAAMAVLVTIELDGTHSHPAHRTGVAAAWARAGAGVSDVAGRCCSLVTPLATPQIPELGWRQHEASR